MLYRTYTPADLPRIYAIEELCFQPPIRFSRIYMQRLIASAGSATWVAEEDSQIAGFTIVEWYDDAGDPSLAQLHGSTSGTPIRVAYIQTIEVAPAFRRRGIASQLLRQAETSAKASGATLIWLHVESTNQTAISLYRAHGFTLHRREDHYYARGRNAEIYIKSLAAIP